MLWYNQYKIIYRIERLLIRTSRIQCCWWSYIWVISNKADLYEPQQVPDEKGKAFNGFFQLVYRQSNDKIYELFDKIGHKYFDPNYDNYEDENKEKKLYEKKAILN